MSLSEPLLKTQQVARSLGVSVSTIKRWVDVGALGATRTVGRHRLIPLSEAVQFARKRGLPHEGLAALSGAVEGGSGAIDDPLRDDLLDSLRRGEARRAKVLIRSVFAAGNDAAAVADLLIRPVMERIGHGWMVGAVDVYEEHQATQIVASALAEQVQRLSRGDRGAGPLALGAAPEGDPYTLSLQLGELVLRGAGWDVRNLGPNLPLSSLGAAVRDLRPGLVFLSVNYLADPERFCDEYLAFYENAAAHGVAVMLGGRALGPGIRARVVAAGFGERMAHLAEFARRLAPASAPPAAADAAPLPKQPGSMDPWNGELPSSRR